MFDVRLALPCFVITAALTVAACSTPPAPETAKAPAPAAPAPIVVTPPVVTQPAPATAARLAPRDPALEQWKRQAAERIHGANSKQLFQGRPHHLLRGVVVADVTVDRAGKVTDVKIVRSPGIAAQHKVVTASLHAASPLPAPPALLAPRGRLTYSETWLFTNDGRWQVRTLALPQE
jgi:periplasmic protein TonB